MEFNPVQRRDALPTTRRIRTFVVYDLETNDLPYLWSKVAITELSMYALAAQELQHESSVAERVAATTLELPEMPRVMHKLNLFFNPRQIIAPKAEELTGLNNFMLEHESSFNANAGTLLTSFLQHLPQPICLVAHNGDNFDFPILKQSLQKWNVTLSAQTLCVDSLRAFWGIDRQKVAPKVSATRTEKTSANRTTEASKERTAITAVLAAGAGTPLDVTAAATSLDEADSATPLDAAAAATHNNAEASTAPIAATAAAATDAPQFSSTEKPHDDVDDAPIDWQRRNEVTPKRPTTAHAAGVKRASNRDDSTNGDASCSKRRLSEETFKSRRVLFPNKPTERFPPKGVYTQPKLFERVFQQCPMQAHYAEADVDALTKLMLAYGIDFLAYAENHAKPFADVRRP